MCRIRIKETPSGDAPEWVREALVGIELDADENATKPPKNDMETLINRQNLVGYKVKMTALLKALEPHNEKAHEWLEMHCHKSASMVLRAEICEPVMSTCN